MLAEKSDPPKNENGFRKAFVSIVSAQFFQNQNIWDATLVSYLTENPKILQLHKSFTCIQAWSGKQLWCQNMKLLLWKKPNALSDSVAEPKIPARIAIYMYLQQILLKVNNSVLFVTLVDGPDKILLLLLLLQSYWLCHKNISIIYCYTILTYYPHI